MKTNIDQHIKSQLNERNLTPSESSWEKLSQMMNEEKPQPKTIRFPKWWTVAVAASVVICVSIFVVNSFGETKNETIQIVNSEKKSEKVQQETNSIPTEEMNSEMVSNEPQTIPNQNQINSDKTQIQPKVKQDLSPDKLRMTVQQELKPETLLVNNETKPEIKPTEIEKPKENLAVQNPPKKEKKHNYVDSDMLLYSVENNQAISETNKDNTRLVIIDFNK